MKSKIKLSIEELIVKSGTSVLAEKGCLSEGLDSYCNDADDTYPPELL